MKASGQNKPKPLFPLPALVLLVAAVAMVLVLLYQYASKQLPANQAAEVVKEQFADRWQAEFHQMLSAKTASPEAVLALAEQLSAKGYWKESRQLLAEKMPYPFPAELGTQVAGVKLKNSLDAYYAASSADQSGTDEPRLDVRAQLQAIGDTRQIDVETLTTLAKQSADFGLLPQAATLYAQLAERQSPSSQWWAEAAKWSAQAGDNTASASYWQKALEQAKDADETRLYTYAWMEQAIKAGQQDAVSAQINDTTLQGKTIADLQQLATISQRLGRPELSSQLYEGLAQQDSSSQQKWYEKATYWAEQAGELPRAAHLLEQALAVATQPTEIHALRSRLLDMWTKAKQPDKAVQVVGQLLASDTSDSALLEKGVFTALAAKDIAQARQWNQRYLELNPHQASTFLRQADIEIMANDFTQAAHYLKEAVRLEPETIVLRERWAFVSERNGDKALALELWDWLYQRTGKPEYRRNQVQVAHGTQQGRGMNFLQQLAQTQPLPGNTPQEVFWSLAARSPDEAEAFMQDYLQRHAIEDRQQWQQLAEWQVGQKRLEQALTTWQHIEAAHGANAQTQLMRMQLHWELKQADQAAAVLDGVNSQLTEATPYQVEIMTELLLNSMQLALDSQQPDAALGLIKRAEQQGQAFELKGRYWLLRAQLAVQQQQLAQAKEFYQHLLFVEREATPVRKQALLQYLDLLKTDEDAAAFEKLFQELAKQPLDSAEKNRLYEMAVSRALERKDAQKLASLTVTAQTQGVELAPWLQLGVAMQTQDKPAITRLLASGETLSVGDRVTALVTVGREDEAYAEARRAIRKATTPEAKEQARALALSLAEGRVSSVSGLVKAHQMDGLALQEQTVEFRQGQGKDAPFGYSVKASRTRLSGAVVPKGVQHETDVTAGLHWRRSDRQVDATLGLNQREGEVDYHANVRLRQQLTENVNGEIAYGYQETPTESAWLKANAQRNQLQAGLDVRLGEHTNAQLAVWQNEFSERDSQQALAQGQGGRVTVVHRQRLGEQAEWFTGIQGSAENYEAASHLEGNLVQGVPADARSVTLLAGVSNGAIGAGIPPQDDKLRYNLSAAVGKQFPQNTLTHHVEASVGKRVSQDDEVGVGVFYDKGDRAGADQGAFLQYRKWLDFRDENNERQQ